MNTELLNHKPSALWKNFENLNAVPRPSKKEERVIEFMRQFGENLKLETIVDDCGNVIIRKPATPGRENRTGVILQGHLDMVHQKNANTQFDFSTEGIQSYIDNGWLKAKGTTLGADNGVGVASIMTVLAATDLQHGPIEALFTIDEETGMTGAFKLQPNVLTGTILLNTDTEDEGELCIGCAGGIDTNVVLNFEEVAAPAGVPLKLSVTGLRGGHSGCEIHLGRGNANNIMNRLLWCQCGIGLHIASINGGSLRNAIPRESFAVLMVDTKDETAFREKIAKLTTTIKSELAIADPDLKIELESIPAPAKVLTAETKTDLLNGIYAAPCGVYRMSDGVPGLVETSTSLARVLVEKGTAQIQFLTRSSVDTAKQDLANMIAATFQMIGAKVEHNGAYPGWKPNRDSEILELMKTVYADLFGKPPTVNAVHAGLECGIIGSHYPELDMISFGPTIKNPHSPDEKCDIASVEKYWRYLVAVLEKI